VKAIVGSPWARATVSIAAAGGVIALLWFRGPSWSAVGDAFGVVEWRWVAAAVGLNLLSVLVRAVAWRTVICQAIPEPYPSFPLVFSAFSVGLFANAVLPGRIGELARVAVLNRKIRQESAWATLLGTVFAHRVFDLVAAMGLVVFVVTTAHIPDWAVTSLIVVVVAGVALFSIAVVSARQHQFSDLGGLSSMRKLVRLARHGLGVMREPWQAAIALFFQLLGWTCQLFAVWTAMHAFHIHKPIPAAALVLVLMNVATLFPVWPGNNVGLLQAAIAIPLNQYYNVARATGVAFGFGLQAIEASVGIGVGLIFLAREGLSLAMLRVMPDASQAELPNREVDRVEHEDAEPSRARVPG
jgi:uncharacterized protein (TIRG00374 family)